MRKDNPYEPTPAVTTPASPAPKLEVGRLSASALRLWLGSFVPLAILAAIGQIGFIPLLLISAEESLQIEPLVLVQLIASKDVWLSLGALGAALLIGLPLSVLASAGSLLVIRARERSQPLGPIDALRAARPVFRRFLLTHVLVSLVFLALSLPLDALDKAEILPAPVAASIDQWQIPLFICAVVMLVAVGVLMCLWVAVYPIVVFEGRSSFEALRRSARLARGHLRRIFGAAFILAFAVVIASVTGAALRYATGHQIAQFLTSQVTAVALGPLITAFFYAAYERLLELDPERDGATADR